MATQILEKDAENITQPAPSPPYSGSDLGDHPTEAHDALPEDQPHPLASVLGSFRNDLASLDAIMAGVEKYRQQMEEEEDPSE